MTKTVRVAFSLATILVVASLIVGVATSQTPRNWVFIKSNGNVEPSSAPIQRNGNTYTFFENVYAGLVVEKNGVVIDGAGHTLHGPYNGTHENLWVIGEGADQVSPGMTIPYSVGVDLGGDASGLTIMNLNIKNFSIGTYIWTKNNSFISNSVSECIVGVLLSGSDNNVTRNYLEKNEIGLFFGTNQPGTVPLNLTVSHNSFQRNVRQLGGCLCSDDYNASEPIHTWDDGREGNYWSDYNGSDIDFDGIGDIAYVFDPQNQDRYPLMASLVSPPTVASGNPDYVLVLVLVAAALATVVFVAALRIRSKRNRATRS